MDNVVYSTVEYSLSDLVTYMRNFHFLNFGIIPSQNFSSYKLSRLQEK